MLKDNPYFFLKNEPAFVYGRIPFDGPTSSRDDIAGEKDQENTESINWQGYYMLGRGYAGGDEGDLT